jgi:hypothetical protein
MVAADRNVLVRTVRRLDLLKQFPTSADSAGVPSGRPQSQEIFPPVGREIPSAAGYPVTVVTIARSAPTTP